MVYNLEDLKKAYEEGERFKFLYFWGNTPAKDGQIYEASMTPLYYKHLTLPTTP